MMQKRQIAARLKKEWPHPSRGECQIREIKPVDVKKWLASYALRPMPLISYPTICRANDQVTRELDAHGFWSDRLDPVTVRLVPFSLATYGWQHYGSTGDIIIPRVSLARVGDHVMGRPRVSLRDVLRHEWAHAIADTHRGLFRSRRFSDVFSGSHGRYDACLDWDPGEHVSLYAATNPGEDFAETFMLWIKHGGRMPARFQGATGIRGKWNFVDELANAIESGARRW